MTRMTRLILALSALAMVTASSGQVDAGKARILIVKSDDLPQYNEPIDRFAAAIDGHVEILDIGGSKKRGQRLLAQAKANGAIKGIFALGTQAAYLSKTQLPEVPTAFAMVLDHKRYELAPPATGVAVEIPVDALLTRFKLLLPNLRSIGLIRSEHISDATVDVARRAADALGFDLIVEEVDYADEVAGAYRRIRSQIDALWMPADPLVVTRSSFRYLSERTASDGIAFLAFSENFVRAGALLSVSPDYATMGSQAAVLLERAIATPAAPPAVQAPLGSSLVVNASTARRINLEITAAMRMMADVIIEEE